jgi:hypothetical protein
VQLPAQKGTASSMLAVLFKSFENRGIKTKPEERFASKTDEFATEIRHMWDFRHDGCQM